MTDTERLKRIEKRHFCTVETAGTCYWCRDPWPCDAWWLLQRVRELEGLAYWIRPLGPDEGETWKDHAVSLQQKYDLAQADARHRVRELEQCIKQMQETESASVANLRRERDT